MSTLVMKFGGTSVGSMESINQATDIVLDLAKQWDNLVVVVSAMSSVTDALIQSAQTAVTEKEDIFRKNVDRVVRLQGEINKRREEL